MTTKLTPSEVIQLARNKDIQFIDLKFTDLPGTFQHFSIPISQLTQEIFKEGVGFDGSSIRGFQQIHESDMMLVPDPTSAFVDPVLKIPTLSMICDVRDPVAEGSYTCRATSPARPRSTSRRREG